jgi:hypothetical protein
LTSSGNQRQAALRTISAFRCGGSGHSRKRHSNWISRRTSFRFRVDRFDPGGDLRSRRFILAHGTGFVAGHARKDAGAAPVHGDEPTDLGLDPGSGGFAQTLVLRGLGSGLCFGGFRLRRGMLLLARGDLMDLSRDSREPGVVLRRFRQRLCRRLRTRRGRGTLQRGHDASHMAVAVCTLEVLHKTDTLCGADVPARDLIAKDSGVLRD